MIFTKVDNAGELLKEYADGKIKLTPFQNFAFGDERKIFDSLLKRTLNKTLKVHNVKSKLKKDDAFRFTIYVIVSFTFFTKELFDEIFGEGILHDEFGEGECNSDELGLQGHEYCSYLFKYKDAICHIGFDHRGIGLECDVKLSIKDIIEIINQFVEIVIGHKREKTIGVLEWMNKKKV